jgi:hypothetical protein
MHLVKILEGLCLYMCVCVFNNSDMYVFKHKKIHQLLFITSNTLYDNKRIYTETPSDKYPPTLEDKQGPLTSSMCNVVQSALEFPPNWVCLSSKMGDQK